MSHVTRKPVFEVIKISDKAVCAATVTNREEIICVFDDN